MSILSQHGFQTENITESGLNKGCIEGVILSPYQSGPDDLKEYARNLRSNHKKATLLFDPHFYISTITNANDGHLTDYDYYKSHLDMTCFSPNLIQDYVRKLVKFQSIIDFDAIVSPSIMIGDFSEYQALVTIQLGQATIEQIKENKIDKPVLISLTFEESALDNWDALKNFLNSITLLDVVGFFINVRLKDTTSYPVCDPDSLGNLMYFTYVLSNVNKFKTFFGYTDFISVLLHAFGATAAGNGWSTSLRHFPMLKFEGKGPKGGRQSSRYSSVHLLNSMTVVPDLQSIADAGFLQDVLSGSSYDKALSPNPSAGMASWSREISCLHHWEILSNLARKVTKDKNVNARISVLKGLIKNGLDIYSKLDQGDIVWKQPSSDNRNLLCWQQAIDKFEKRLKT